MTTLPYKMIDADQHYYETDDCFTRHIPKKYIDEGRAVHIVRKEGEKEGRVFIGKNKVTFFGRAPCDSTGRPGALLEYYKTGGDSGKGMFSQGNISADDLPESRVKEARLEWLKNENVEASILLPSLQIGVEYDLRNDPEALGANLTAFNRWLEEDWGYGTDGHLFGAPTLSLDNLNWAVKELDRVIKCGARIIHLKAGPLANHKSPADPMFDPFWARCEEAGIIIGYHLGNTGEVDYYASLWGESATRPQHRLTPFQRVTSFGDRAIADTLCALVTGNLFGRFPKLTVLSLEFGSEWVTPLIKKMDRAARMCGSNDWPFGNINERPRDVFRRHIKISPFPEDNVIGLIEMIGINAVIGGSDWPHPEGILHPTELPQHIKGGTLNNDDLRLFMRENTGKLLGLV